MGREDIDIDGLFIAILVLGAVIAFGIAAWVFLYRD